MTYWLIGITAALSLMASVPEQHGTTQVAPPALVAR